MQNKLLPAIICLTTLLPALGFAEIVISDATVRPATKATHSTAFYMQIENTGNDDDALIGASSSCAKETMIHNTIEKEGVNRMLEIDRLAIPAHQKVVMKPGGLHVMAMDIIADVKKGSKVKLTLNFEKAGTKEIEVLAN